MSPRIVRAEGTRPSKSQPGGRLLDRARSQRGAAEHLTDIDALFAAPDPEIERQRQARQEQTHQALRSMETKLRALEAREREVMDEIQRGHAWIARHPDDEQPEARDWLKSLHDERRAVAEQFAQSEELYRRTIDDAEKAGLDVSPFLVATDPAAPGMVVTP